jgi:hypothetical protein
MSNKNKKFKQVCQENKKKQFELTDIDKYKAIVKVVRNGPRYSEWAEASLLHLIEAIIDGKEYDFSSKNLKNLFDKYN